MLEDLRELLHRQPFEPFHVVTTSGERYAVENPDNVAVSDSRISLFPPRTDKWVLIRLNQVIALESVEKAA
jgi:hypothetical protein